jgi:cytochrome c556
MRNFKVAAWKLELAAKDGDAAAIGAAFGNLGKSCGGCHKAFRAKKK